MSTSTSKHPSVLLGAIAGGTVVVAIFVATPPFIRWWSGAYDSESESSVPAVSGQFGDQFGAANALFSGLAFTALIATVIMQRNELEHQRDSNRWQAKALLRQGFETTFFQMLHLYSQIVSSTRVLPPNPGSGEKDGKAAFEAMRKHVMHGMRAKWPLVDDWHGTKDNADLNERRKALRLAYNLDYDKNNRAQAMGHYFRQVYLLFKIVDESEMEDKQYYARIARAQLSESELVLLFYNCLGTYGENMLPYAEKYRFFDNLDPNELLHADDRYLIKSTYVGEKVPPTLTDSPASPAPSPAL